MLDLNIKLTRLKAELVSELKKFNIYLLIKTGEVHGHSRTTSGTAKIISEGSST